MGAAGDHRTDREGIRFDSSGAFDPQNYGYLWWVETVDGVDAYCALGFGGQRVEVVPARHLVIVVSTDVNLNPYASTASPDDTQRLVNIIVPLAR